ncbi:MAG TPA: TolC family protein [Gemmatimonadaceae bacterium]|jgi:outer membrane protein TolC|nr:TolC family protein [Gemmatimonadaceae bacterium]
MRLLLGLCALAPLTGAALAQAPTDSLRLSRRQAIAEALTRNAQLEIAREQIAEARARRVTAIAIPDPSLSAAFDQAAGPFTFSSAGARPVGLGLSIPFPDKFRLNNRIGLADVRASESNSLLQQHTVGLQASATYDSLLVALKHRGNLREARDLANDFLKRTEIRFEAGTAAKLDVIQAQVAVAQAENDLIANERDIANAQASLNRTLGRIVGAPIAPTDSLDMPAPLPDSSTIEQIALANRPELAIIQQQQLGARAATGLIKEFWLPDLTFAVQRDYAVNGSAPVFTTGLSMPLPAFYWQHSRGDIAQAQHFERELAATYRDTRAQVTQDVRAAYANASTAMRQVDFIRDQLVPAAREAYRVSSTSYSLGGSSALEVLTARQALLQAESQLADALAAASTARADLDRALGLLPNGSTTR